MTVAFLDTVVLRKAIPAQRLDAGDVGAAVEKYAAKGIDVQAVPGSGRAQALLRLAAAAVREPLASRVHLRLERRRGKFVATDHGANGTSLEMNGQSVHIGRTEKLVLVGSGRLAPGNSLDKAQEVVSFECLED